MDSQTQLLSADIEPPSRKPSTTAVVALSSVDLLPAFVYDTRIDPKTRARLIENEMNEQAKLVQDLQQLGASRNTIETEERKLHELQVLHTPLIVSTLSYRKLVVGIVPVDETGCGYVCIFSRRCYFMISDKIYSRGLNDKVYERRLLKISWGCVE